MSGDETLVWFVCLALALVLWGRWLWLTAAVARRCSRLGDRWLLLAAPLAGAALLFAVLRKLSSFDVRESPLYLSFYMMMGAAWVAVTARFLGLFGLSARDDVIERRNPAAARAVGGALVGLTLCFAGGNIGDGPGWWVVVFCAALATLALLLLWVLLDRAAGVADTVTVDRDAAAGTRVAAFFIAAGLILGRAVAGDWSSAVGTVLDFAFFGWPALALALAAAAVERRLRPTPERTQGEPVVHGLAPAALYLAVAWLALAWAGWPS